MNVTVKDLCVSYSVQSGLFQDALIEVLRNVSFTIHPGEVVALVGPNGVGKTTLLRALCGLLPITSGEISFGGERVTHGVGSMRPAQLPTQMIVADSLYLQFTVAYNIVYGSLRRGVSRVVCARRLIEAAEQLEIADLLSRRVNELSEGQKQRVIIARMLVSMPEKPVLLFDEPLSHIDPESREEFQQLFYSAFARSDTSAIYVTHDRREAIDLCGNTGRVLSFREGTVEQFGTIPELVRDPKSDHVKRFFSDWIVSEHRVFDRLLNPTDEGGVQ